MFNVLSNHPSHMHAQYGQMFLTEWRAASTVQDFDRWHRLYDSVTMMNPAGAVHFTIIPAGTPQIDWKSSQYISQILKQVAPRTLASAVVVEGQGPIDRLIIAGVGLIAVQVPKHKMGTDFDGLLMHTIAPLKGDLTLYASMIAMCRARTKQELLKKHQEAARAQRAL